MRQLNFRGHFMLSLRVNRKVVSVDVEPETPLLWVIRDTIGLTGTKFGCGIALCGACTVHNGSSEWKTGAIVRDARQPGCRAGNHDDRGIGRNTPGAGALARRRCSGLWVLSVGTNHGRGGPANQNTESHGCRYQSGDHEFVPMRDVFPHA